MSASACARSFATCAAPKPFTFVLSKASEPSILSPFLSTSVPCFGWCLTAPSTPGMVASSTGVSLGPALRPPAVLNWSGGALWSTPARASGSGRRVSAALEAVMASRSRPMREKSERSFANFGVRGDEVEKSTEVLCGWKCKC